MQGVYHHITTPQFPQQIHHYIFKHNHKKSSFVRLITLQFELMRIFWWRTFHFNKREFRIILGNFKASVCGERNPISHVVYLQNVHMTYWI